MKRISLFLSVFLLTILMISLFQLPVTVNAGNGNPPPGWEATKQAKQELIAAHKATLQAGKSANPNSNSNPQKLQGKKSMYTGTYAAVDGSTLTMNLADGSQVMFILTEQTRVKIPTMGNSSSLAGLQPGVNIKVQAVETDGVLTALSIMVVPGKPEKVHRVGEVTEYEAGVSITVMDKTGETSTFLIVPETKLLPWERADLLQVGSRVTIICPRDVTGGPLTAQGIVIHPEVEDGEETPEE